MSKKKHKLNPSNQAASPQLFIRKLHSTKNLRNGLSAARSTTKPKDFPSIVRQLTHNSTYAVLLNPLGFPKSLSELEQKRNKLSKLTTAGELMWCGSILAQHSKELNTFVKNRDKFYETFLCSNYDEAKRLLDDIQEKFGYSLWLIKNRLQLLQEAGGLQAQKSFC